MHPAIVDADDPVSFLDPCLIGGAIRNDASHNNNVFEARVQHNTEPRLLPVKPFSQSGNAASLLPVSIKVQVRRLSFSVANNDERHSAALAAQRSYSLAKLIDGADAAAVDGDDPVLRLQSGLSCEGLIADLGNHELVPVVFKPEPKFDAILHPLLPGPLPLTVSFLPLLVLLLVLLLFRLALLLTLLLLTALLLLGSLVFLALTLSFLLVGIALFLLTLLLLFLPGLLRLVLFLRYTALDATAKAECQDCSARNPCQSLHVFSPISAG